MADYLSVAGTDLARVLCGDGWTPERTDLLPDYVVLWKGGGNHKPIQITLYLPVGKSKVQRICSKAGISTDHFETLYRDAPVPDWLPTDR